MGLIFGETETFYVELNERAEAATSSYSEPGDVSQYIYSVLVAKNQKKIQSSVPYPAIFGRCWFFDEHSKENNCCTARKSGAAL